MKRTLFTTISIILICYQSFAQDPTKDRDSTRIPVTITTLKEAIKSQNLKGLLHFSKMNVESSALKQALTSTNNCTTALPTDLSGLTGGWTVFFNHMSLETAAKVGVIAIGDVSSNLGKEVFVYEQMNYKDVPNCTGGGKTTYGAGVRLTILVKKVSANVNLSNLGAIAAAAEVKEAEVTVSMKTIGLSGPKIVGLIPNAGTYSVEKHVQYLQAIDAITKATVDTTTVVTPEIISFTIPVDNDVEFVKATYTTLALQRIAKGDSFNVAKLKVRVSDELTNQTIKNVYDAVVTKSDDTKPSAMQILKAKQILNNSRF